MSMHDRDGDDRVEQGDVILRTDSLRVAAVMYTIGNPHAWLESSIVIDVPQ